MFACMSSVLLLFVTSSSDNLLSLFAKGVILGLTSIATVYIGIMLTSSSVKAKWLNIPSAAAPLQTKRKELVIDMSALEDSRLIELARSGLLDHQLVAPTFLVKELLKASESMDEHTRYRAKKCQEHLKRLEIMPNLGLQVKEFHLSDAEELQQKMSRAAKQISAYILTSQDPSQIKTEEDMPTTISLDCIAAALKPGAQRGEVLSIKIQRLGKEPKQGVGYLEDGTMVVVNGGGEFLGQTIRTQVLSQKYSSSGKIIFCNAIGHDEGGDIRSEAEAISPYHLTYQ